MGIQLRITLPDQPGALARVTATLARAGADVYAVSVLESEAGRATDDFRVRWDGKDERSLVDAVSACPGVTVLGCRQTRWLLDGRPDLDLMTCLLADPERGIETLVDMAPPALEADWAELRAPVRRLPLLYGTSPLPRDDVAPENMPVRAFSSASGDAAWAYLPIVALRCVLVLGRDNGPSFLRSELVHAERVLDLAIRTLHGVLPTGRYDAPSELTSHLLAAAV